MSGPTNSLHLRVITPARVIREEYVSSVTAPSAEGEITILPHHSNLFSYLKAGVLKIRTAKDESLYSIGGGYLETDGAELNILVSKIYGQDEIDEKITAAAIERAKATLKDSKDKIEIQEAKTLLRRSLIDMKLLRRKKKPQ